MLRMPGPRFAGPLPPLGREGLALGERLRGHVERLAGEIGERNMMRHGALEAAASYIAEAFAGCGIGAIREQAFDVAGRPARNIEAMCGEAVCGARSGDRAGASVVVGAHYDSITGSPGANDNASGVAALIEIARSLAATPLARPVRLVAFANEEPPFFLTEHMGSLVYAREAAASGLRIAGMLALETIGYYSDREGSQRYPPPFSLFYPSRGDFIGFVANLRSWRLVRRVVGSFRRHASFPSEGLAAPGWMTGIGWSDHAAFWRHGYRAVMVTDTALFRYAEYHTPADTPEILDYERLARVVAGLSRVVAELAGERGVAA